MKRLIKPTKNLLLIVSAYSSENGTNVDCKFIENEGCPPKQKNCKK